MRFQRFCWTSYRAGELVHDDRSIKLTRVNAKATDCAILVIAITTVHTITRRHISAVSEGRWQYRQAVLLSCIIWSFPFFTGTVY